MAKTPVTPSTVWVPNLTTPRADQAYKAGGRPTVAGRISEAAFNSAVNSGYQGAFKVDITGDGNMASQFMKSRIAYNPNGNGGAGSLFINGKTNAPGIAEISIPVLNTTHTYGNLTNASVLQSYVRFFDEEINEGVTTRLPVTGVPEFSPATIKTGGMQVVNGELYVDVYDSYDATANDTQTTLIVRDCTNLATAQVDGWFEKAGSARTVKYYAEIPAEWQSALGGEYLCGMGSGMSISGRFSEGPSLYTINPANFSGQSGVVATTEHQNYPVGASDTKLSTASFPKQAGLYNHNDVTNWNGYNRSVAGDLNDSPAKETAGNNLMWTQTSDAVCGFIIPGTDTFVVIGKNGCINGSGGYKITNDVGKTEPGPAAYFHDDYHSYYWLFDLTEIIAATNPWDVEPYAYGVFDGNNWKGVEGAGSSSTVVGMPAGGTFDMANKKLYIIRNDVVGSNNKPIVDVYDLSALGA